MRRPYFSTFELLLLALVAALVVAANVALRLPVRAPGHSGIAWMALLVAARGVVPKLGSASLVGIISGVLAAMLGVGDKGGLDTAISYAAAGMAVDVAAGLVPASPLGRAVAGIAGNLTKLGAKLALEIWIGIPAGFLALGRAYPAVLHVVFGAAGGYLGHLVLEALRRAGFFAYLESRR
jgi:hypothetical protein